MAQLTILSAKNKDYKAYEDILFNASKISKPTGGLSTSIFSYENHVWSAAHSLAAIQAIMAHYTPNQSFKVFVIKHGYRSIQDYETIRTDDITFGYTGGSGTCYLVVNGERLLLQHTLVEVVVLANNAVSNNAGGTNNIFIQGNYIVFQQVAGTDTAGDIRESWVDGGIRKEQLDLNLMWETIEAPM